MPSSFVLLCAHEVASLLRGKRDPRAALGQGDDRAFAQQIA